MCFHLLFLLVSSCIVAPHVLQAPTPQRIVLNKDSIINCLVTGGARTVDWWRNRIRIASSDDIETGT